MSVNIALNPSGAGLPSPLESDRGWGGGSYPWEIVDGQRSYNHWAHGLAFTGGVSGWAGEPGGIRQATINFGTMQTFDKVIIWWHGVNDTPATGTLEYWNGSGWVNIASTRTYGAQHADGPNAGYSDSDEYTFSAVTGSKVRYSFDNRGLSISGQQMVHGWIYEFEVYGSGSPDIQATSLTWNPAQGGVDFGYRVSGAALTQDTIAALYWTRGTSFADVLGGPVYDTPLARLVGDHGPFYVSPAVLGTPPPGATHLLLVTDPANRIAESNETNNVRALAIQLPDLSITAMDWILGQGGISYRFQVSGASLPTNTTVDLFWATGPNLNDRIGSPITSMDAGTVVGRSGDYIPASVFHSRPTGATHVILVADPDNRIAESDENNNVRVVQIVHPPLVRLQLPENVRIGQEYPVTVAITNLSFVPETFNLAVVEYPEGFDPGQPIFDIPGGQPGQVITLSPGETREISANFSHTWQWIPRENPVVPVLTSLDKINTALQDALTELTFDAILQAAGRALGHARTLRDQIGIWSQLFAAQRSQTFYYQVVLDGQEFGDRERLTISVPRPNQAAHFAFLATSSVANLAFGTAVATFITGEWPVSLASLATAVIDFEQAHRLYEDALRLRSRKGKQGERE